MDDGEFVRPAGLIGLQCCDGTQPRHVEIALTEEDGDRRRGTITREGEQEGTTRNESFELCKRDESKLENNVQFGITRIIFRDAHASIVSAWFRFR